MGFFWDLIQQGQLSEQRRHSETLEGRVTELERQVDAGNKALRLLLERLEVAVGQDLDRDGRIGS